MASPQRTWVVTLNHSDDALRRFQHISTLTIGTSLLYRAQNKHIIPVYFDGLNNGGSMIRLRAGDKTYYEIPPALALNVEFPAREFASLPKRSNKWIDETIPPFLTNFFGQEAAKAAILESHSNCVIIGPIGRLDEEVNCVPFAVQVAGGGFEQGVLQDIIRTRRFSIIAETYQSDIYHTHSKDHAGIEQEMPPVIIFDGATSFLKWRACWSHPHYIVLLDQTEPGFDSAVQVFNEEYIKNHLKDVVLSKQLELPKRVPISIYQELRK